MKKLLLVAAMLAGCQTTPEPSPYDGKCYSLMDSSSGPMVVRVVSKTDEGDKYNVQAYVVFFGSYGEGQVAAQQLEGDVTKGNLKEQPCPKNKQTGEDLFDNWHQKFTEWKAQKDQQQQTK